MTFSKIAMMAGVSAFLMSAPSAFAIDSAAFNYTSPKTGYLSVSTLDFAPDGSSSAANSYFNSWFGNTLTGDGCFNTGLNFPNGALVTSVRIWYSGAAFVNFTQTELTTGTTAPSLSQSFPTNGTGDRRTSILAFGTPVKIDTLKYSYGLGICVGTSDSFRGARMQYSYTNAGD